jgi:AcrR family transcriptional regulator
MADRRQEILDAALRGFAAKGLAGTTVEEVRERSGASVGSIYHHFGDKEGIAAALYVDVLTGYQRGVLAALAKGGEPSGTVEGLVRHHLRWVARNRDAARFLLSGRPRRAASEIAQLNQSVFEEMSAWLDEQVRTGRVREMPFELFFSLLIGPAQEFCRHWLEGRMSTSMRTAERELGAAASRALLA